MLLIVLAGFIELRLTQRHGSVFNLTYEAERPSSADYNGVYDAAYPGLWFGDDYVIVGWYAQQYQTLLLRVYSYGGRWSAPWETVLQGVNPATTTNNPTAAQQLDEVLVAMGPIFSPSIFITSPPRASTSSTCTKKRNTSSGSGRRLQTHPIR